MHARGGGSRQRARCSIACRRARRPTSTARVVAARRAFEQGATGRACDRWIRERLLLRLAELVEAHAQELAEIEALDNGKPVTMARAVDVALVVDFLRYMAGWATKIEGSTMEVSVPWCATASSSATPGASRWAWSARSSRGTSRC